MNVAIPPGANRLLREFRRWVTAQAKSAGLAAAPRLSPRMVDRLERMLARWGPHAPVLARQVALNMRMAGVGGRAEVDEHFRQLARHLSNSLRIFRAGFAPQVVADMARRDVAIDGSIELLKSALTAGRGAVIIPPHVCNFVLTVVRLNQEIPLSVYLRWSKDPRKRALKEAWCKAAGLDAILEPANASDPSARAAACVEILRSGRALVMTPDIVQRAGSGAATQLFGRVVDLPTGPASIAMLAEAPLFPVFGSVKDGIHTIVVKEPHSVVSRSRAQGGRSAAVREAMQAWGDHFAAFLRQDPAAWFLWGDSRWTRFFQGDRGYSSPIQPAEAGGRE